MERFSELLARLSVTVTSTDGGVSANLTAATGLTVRLRPEHLTGHDDTSLARLVSRTLARTLAAARRATTVARDRTGVVSDPRRTAGSTIGRRRLSFETAAERTTGTGRSRDGDVTVEVTGATGIRVRLRPGTVARLDPDRLAAAVNEAVGLARAEQGTAVVAAYHHAFDPSTSTGTP